MPESERDRLLGVFTPLFPDVIADHVTLAFGVPETHPLPTAEQGRVVGFATDGMKVEALVVEIDGTTRRPDGKVFHITWSIDRSKGGKPYQSNEAIRTGTRADLDQPIAIRLEPRRFETK